METMWIILCAALYGVSMKMADLFNEHGLHWFKGDAIFFGVLCGIFGSVLIIIGDAVVASALAAMMLAFLPRNRLDCHSHQIGATIMIAAGMIFHTIVAMPFLIFLGIFIFFGAFKDYTDDVLHATGRWARFNELAWYYPIPPLIYGLISGKWILFGVLTIYNLSYIAVKWTAKHRGYP